MRSFVLVAVLLAVSGCPADPGDPDGGSTCPALTGAEVVHQTDITSAETWAGDGTVHHVTFGITIRPGGTLTLAPCAVVKVNGGLQLTITGTPSQPAALVANGTATQPVLMTSAVAGQKWGQFRALNPDATVRLAYTTLEAGGSGTGHGAVLSLRGNGLTERDVIPVLKVDHVTLKDSEGTALLMESAAAFTADSAELTITGGGAVAGGDYAIEIAPLAAGTLPTLHLSGNAHDAIRVTAGSQYISRDLTLKNRGAPYYFYFDRVRVTDQTLAVTPTLTIEPGVELRFDDYLQIGYVNPGTTDAPGRLIAVGTAAQPIVFTSSKTPRAAGDWPGIWLFNAEGSRLEHVRIEYAGGFNGVSSNNCKPTGSTDEAALFISWPDEPYVPASADFVAVEIANSASHGINSMWKTTDTFGPDLTAGFTFSGLNGCRQTKNGATTGCGTPDPTCLVQ